VSKNRFEEVVFMDDFFRTTDNGLPSYPANRRFLSAFFGDGLRRLGLKVRDEYACSDGGGIPVGAIMRSLELEPSVSGWAAAGIADLTSALAREYPLRIGPKTLVIGWGLPPSLLRYIDEQGAGVMDVEVDPMRFAPHLHLCIRTNDEGIRRELAKCHVSKDVFSNAATTIRAYFARRGNDTLVHPSLVVGLFAGQTEIDLALVHDGQLIKPSSAAAQIASWASEVDVLLVKQHPYASNNDDLAALLSTLPNALPIDHNIYGMFCARNLRFVGALSSGAVKEAQCFGIQGRTAIVPDRSNPTRLPSTCSPWFTVTAEIGSGEYLRKLVRTPGFLDMLNLRSRPTPSSFAAGTLDTIFGARWGLDAGAAGLPSTFIMQLGTTYAFEESAQTLNWLGPGWHEAESWGVWSNGPVSRILVPLAPEQSFGDGALRLTLRGRFYVDASIVSIDIDGQTCLPSMEAFDDLANLHVDIDASLLKRRRLSIITINIADAKRPSDVHGRADRRELGFGLVSMTLSVVTE